MVEWLLFLLMRVREKGRMSVEGNEWWGAGELKKRRFISHLLLNGPSVCTPLVTATTSQKEACSCTCMRVKSSHKPQQHTHTHSTTSDHQDATHQCTSTAWPRPDANRRSQEAIPWPRQSHRSTQEPLRRNSGGAAGARSKRKRRVQGDKIQN